MGAKDDYESAGGGLDWVKGRNLPGLIPPSDRFVDACVEPDGPFAPQELVDRMFPYGWWCWEKAGSLSFATFHGQPQDYPWKACRVGDDGQTEIAEAPFGTGMFEQVIQHYVDKGLNRTTGTFTDRPEDWKHLAYTDIQRPCRTKPLNARVEYSKGELSVVPPDWCI